MVMGPLKRQRLFSKSKSYYIFVFIMHDISLWVLENLQSSLFHIFWKEADLLFAPGAPMLQKEDTVWEAAIKKTAKQDL